MQYPAIVYERSGGDSTYADNAAYRFTKRYQVTYISREPDDGVPEKIAILRLCSYDNFYVADNLNHDIFTLYF